MSYAFSFRPQTFIQQQQHVALSFSKGCRYQWKCIPRRLTYNHVCSQREPSSCTTGGFLLQRQHRLFSTASTNQPGASLDIYAYLEHTANIDRSLHEGMMKALHSVYGKNITLAHLESFGKDGLLALAASVEQQQMKHSKAPRPSRKVTFHVPHHRTSFELDWYKGDSLLDVAKNNEEMLGEYMEGTCGGQMSCCTCHVYLNDATLERLPKTSRAEKDMLDLSFDPRENSRLGCQVELRRSLLEMEEPIIVTLPSDVHNVWK